MTLTGINVILARLARRCANAVATSDSFVRVRREVDQRPPNRPRILVVDDCPVNQLAVAALLRRWHITPLVAADGAEAIALAYDQHFDLILMDLQMPVLDGLTATTRLRRIEREHSRARAPVVAYTSSPFEGNETMLRRYGFDASLEKPCSLQSLERCLERWCGGEFSLRACQSMN